jgi:hypothetical protein
MQSDPTACVSDPTSTNWRGVLRARTWLGGPPPASLGQMAYSAPVATCRTEGEIARVAIGGLRWLGARDDEEHAELALPFRSLLTAVRCAARVLLLVRRVDARSAWLRAYIYAA